MSGEVRSATVRLTAETAQAVANIKQVGDTAETTAARIERTGARSSKAYDSIGRGARNAAVVGVGALALVERANVNFDKAMSGVDAATHETAKNMGLLREAAIKAGADTQFSATQAAQGITELAKAGVSTKAVLGGGLKGALDLAAAGQLGVAEAAETAASAMTQFRLQGKDVPHIADLLAAGAGKAQGSVHDLGAALNQSGLVASQTGLSIEDTTGTLSAFAAAGLVGSDAGTSFKSMLLSLNPRSKEAAGLMKDLNIEAYDAQGNFIGIEKYAGKLRSGLKGLSQEQRASALQTIFGTDAIRAANLLYRNGEQGITRWIKKVDDQGYAAETAARQTDNLAGDIERFTGSLESAFIKGGGGAQKGLRDIVQGAEDLVDKFSQLPSSVQSNVVKTVAALTILSGGIYAVTKAVSGVRAARDVLGFGSKAKGVAGSVLAGGVQKVFVTNPGFGAPGTGAPGVPASGPAVTKKAVAATVAGSAVQAAAAGAIATYGIHAVSQKYAPHETNAGRFGSVPAAGGGGGVGLTGTNAGLDLVSDRAEKAEALAKNLREVAQAQKTASAAFNTAGEIINRTNPLMGKYGKVLRTIPQEIRSYVTAPGAVESISDMQRLAKQFGLTPKQVRTVMELQGFSETQARIAVAGRNYRGLPKAVKTAISTPGAIKSTADVQKLQHRYGLTPKQVKTVMNVAGIPNALAGIRNLQAVINNLHGTTITNYVRTRNLDGHGPVARGVSSDYQPPGDHGARGMLLHSGVRHYARGDVANRHMPEIAQGSPKYRVWAEEETKGEAYIPLANDDRRPRARAIASETVRLLGGVAMFAGGGVAQAATGATSSPGYKVSVVFPSSGVLAGSVRAAEKIAVYAAYTAKSSVEQRAAQVDVLHAQQRIRDLTVSLEERTKHTVGKGKNAHTVTGGVTLRGLDRVTAYAELRSARDELAAVRAQVRTEALAAIRAARAETTTTLRDTGDVFARGTGAASAVASVQRQIGDISTYGQTIARLKAAKASPALLQQLVNRAQQGDFRSAIRLGQALLAQPALLGQLNTSLATLGSVSSNVAALTTDPRLMATAAWNPTSQTVSSKTVSVLVSPDPSQWMRELERKVTHNVTAALTGSG